MKLVWSPLAEISYYENLEYLNKYWSLKEIEKFIDNVEKTIFLIKENPQIFPWWDSEKLYKIGYINKHISFFYSFNQQEVFIHLFWNTHRNPSTLKKYL